MIATSPLIVIVLAVLIGLVFYAALAKNGPRNALVVLAIIVVVIIVLACAGVPIGG